MGPTTSRDYTQRLHNLFQRSFRKKNFLKNDVAYDVVVLTFEVQICENLIQPYPPKLLSLFIITPLFLIVNWTLT
ncbi:hypothetical protein EG68_11025 [Paragonimus skrjabini miyazakii]|uniref:Uncharacterized protein n=1 Tax=Paragonimus skrjabini miyazakii TaxID=59628 RepID=A0A8S9YE70_9TREM|nr:hypothetical protein EG68_11025 [Paragonimus skrjabini miyazakii]